MACQRRSQMAEDTVRNGLTGIYKQKKSRPEWGGFFFIPNRPLKATSVNTCSILKSPSPAVIVCLTYSMPGEWSVTRVTLPPPDLHQHIFFTVIQPNFPAGVSTSFFPITVRHVVFNGLGKSITTDSCRHIEEVVLKPVADFNIMRECHITGFTDYVFSARLFPIRS